jgi:hypothetical protein
MTIPTPREIPAVDREQLQARLGEVEALRSALGLHLLANDAMRLTCSFCTSSLYGVKTTLEIGLAEAWSDERLEADVAALTELEAHGAWLLTRQSPHP